MLHQKECPHCKKKNIYQDETLSVNKQIEDDVSKILAQFHKDLKMTNLGIISPIKQHSKSKGVDEHGGPTSLKSVRGSIKDGGDLKPPVELKKPDPQVTVWKCPDCKYLNSIEQQECGNTKSCNTNLGYIDMPDFMEVGAAELEKAQANFATQAKEPEKEEALPADEWFCEHCKCKNKMTDDPKSALCAKCRKKNDIIEYMISSKADEAATKAEGEYLDHF